MKKYNVTVNGVAYEVEIEEVADGAAVSALVAAPKAAAPKTAAPAAVQGKAGATAIKAPMPGNILKINVKVGDKVKKGDVVCVLEAMKMENDICAPADGVVSSVNVAQGASVATDAVVITLA